MTIREHIQNKLKCTVILALFILLTHLNAYNQSSIALKIDSINIELVEKCFGKEVIKCGFYPNKYGRIPKNFSKLKIEANVQGKIENLEIVFTNNPSLRIGDLKECLIPNMKIGFAKTRYDIFGRNELIIILED